MGSVRKIDFVQRAAGLLKGTMVIVNFGNRCNAVETSPELALER
jgi:hypothetical protein